MRFRISQDEWWLVCCLGGTFLQCALPREGWQASLPPSNSSLVAFSEKSQFHNSPPPVWMESMRIPVMISPRRRTFPPPASSVSIDPVDAPCLWGKAGKTAGECVAKISARILDVFWQRGKPKCVHLHLQFIAGERAVYHLSAGSVAFCAQQQAALACF